MVPGSRVVNLCLPAWASSQSYGFSPTPRCPGAMQTVGRVRKCPSLHPTNTYRAQMGWILGELHGEDLEEGKGKPGTTRRCQEQQCRLEGWIYEEKRNKEIDKCSRWLDMWVKGTQPSAEFRRDGRSGVRKTAGLGDPSHLSSTLRPKQPTLTQALGPFLCCRALRGATGPSRPSSWVSSPHRAHSNPEIQVPSPGVSDLPPTSSPHTDRSFPRFISPCDALHTQATNISSHLFN